jgi:transcriptional regulator with XRE-family HTH domain
MPTRSDIKEIEEIRDPRPKAFGDRLREFRKERGIKQIDFAAMLGIDIQKCRRFETRGTEPDVETLNAMAGYLGITVDELIGYKPAAVNIAASVLDKAGIVFTYDEKEKSFDLFRLIDENKYFMIMDGIPMPAGESELPFLEVFSNEENLSFSELKAEHGFKIFLNQKEYTPDRLLKAKNCRIYQRLDVEDTLKAVAAGKTDGLKVFYRESYDEYTPRELKDLLSFVKTTTLTAEQCKACVFEAKRQTDAAIKAVLNNTYAAFYPSVFWNYLRDKQYADYSVEQIDRLPQTFGERLRALRLRTDPSPSQPEMAKDIGLSLQTYNRYETKGAQPSIDMLKRLALKLHVSVDTLTGFKQDIVSEAACFLGKMNINCTPIKEGKRFLVTVPGRDSMEVSLGTVSFCAYKAKVETDRLIASHLNSIFLETFLPRFWEAVNNQDKMDANMIIDETDYEPYLYEVDLLNKPEF